MKMFMDYSSGGSLCIIFANVFKTKMEQGWLVVYFSYKSHVHVHGIFRKVICLNCIMSIICSIYMYVYIGLV